jgi:hypothetical protein
VVLTCLTKDGPRIIAFERKSRQNFHVTQSADAQVGALPLTQSADALAGSYRLAGRIFASFPCDPCCSDPKRHTFLSDDGKEYRQIDTTKHYFSRLMADFNSDASVRFDYWVSFFYAVKAREPAAALQVLTKSKLSILEPLPVTMQTIKINSRPS